MRYVALMILATLAAGSVMAQIGIGGGGGGGTGQIPSYAISRYNVPYMDLYDETVLSLADDDLSAPISPAGFSINYFGATVTGIRVGSNGYILMDTTAGTVSTQPQHAAGMAISPLWADLKPGLSGAPAHQIAWCCVGNVLWVEWRNVPLYDPSNPSVYYGVRMQVLLYGGCGAIEFRYGAPDAAYVAPDNSEPGAVGISDSGGAEIQYGADNNHIDAQGHLYAWPTDRAIRFNVGGVNSVPGPPQIVDPNPIPDGQVGLPYQEYFTNAGGQPPDYWYIPANGTNLPAGWTMNGQVLVAPVGSVQPGDFHFYLSVAETGYKYREHMRIFELHVDPAPLQITTASTLPGGTDGAPYNFSFSASGGIQPYSWSAAGLPAGWTIDSAGNLTAAGTDVIAGQYNFDVTVQDSQATPDTDTKPFTVTVVPPGTPLTITTTGLPNGTESQPYNFTFNAAGGTPPYSWNATGLPAGWTMSAAGILDAPGASVAVGTYNFTVSVSDSASPAEADVQPFTVVIDPLPPLSIITTSLPMAHKDINYQATLTATGGSGSGYLWTLVSGTLPPGITGVPGIGTPSVDLTGIASTKGSYAFTVQVEDSLGNQDTASFVVDVDIKGLDSGDSDSSGCAATSAQPTSIFVGIFGILFLLVLRLRRGKRCGSGY